MLLTFLDSTQRRRGHRGNAFGILGFTTESQRHRGGNAFGMIRNETQRSIGKHLLNWSIETQSNLEK